jgi:hypothetical protein
MTTKLAHQTQKTVGIGNGMRTATIVATSPVTLSVNGGRFSSGVGVVESYIPAVGDTVAVFRQDSSWLVLGAIGSSGGIGPRGILTGTVVMSFTGVVSSTAPVTFGGLAFPVAPVVFGGIDAGTAPTALWHARPINVTTTGFTMFVFQGTGAIGTWSNIPVNWTATARS